MEKEELRTKESLTLAEAMTRIADALENIDSRVRNLDGTLERYLDELNGNAIRTRDTVGDISTELYNGFDRLIEELDELTPKNTDGTAIATE